MAGVSQKLGKAGSPRGGTEGEVVPTQNLKKSDLNRISNIKVRYIYAGVPPHLPTVKNSGRMNKVKSITDS